MTWGRLGDDLEGFRWRAYRGPHYGGGAAATKPVSHGDASRVAPASRATTYTDPPHTTALTNRRLSRVHHVILIWLGSRA